MLKDRSALEINYLYPISLSLSLHEFKTAVLLSTIYKRQGLQRLAHIAMSSEYLQQFSKSIQFTFEVLHAGLLKACHEQMAEQVIELYFY